jgi:ParB-like chromosome segregation protein Spo0J
MINLLLEQFDLILESVALMDTNKKVSIMNEMKLKMHKISPFKSEPVDCVLWVKNETVHSNDYNPNSVAPPEMELLRLSISADGYTQPIVSMLEQNGETREVIDGFHRNRVGKECEEIQTRVHGYLPVVTINEDRTKINDRVASTIRHNRARGKHKIDAMSDIVIDLKKRNWSDEKISKNLGMDKDEVLRLCQIGGLIELFSDKEFSKSWIVENDSLPETID